VTLSIFQGAYSQKNVKNFWPNAAKHVRGNQVEDKK
jgi:hypothetical protein